MRASSLATLLVAVAACGGSTGSGPPAPPRTQVVASLVATPGGPGDLVVATVGDRPVWGSCVAAQAAGDPARRRAALDECIALEVAAQEAERRGLDRDPDVIDAGRRALVARLVDVELTDKIHTVADLPASFVEPIFAKQAYRLDRPEFRGNFFARIVIDEKERGTPADQAAEAAARAVHQRLAGRTDLFPRDVEDALRAAAPAGMKVEAAAPERMTREGLLPYYADALFALPAVGTVAAPVRSKWGWDLILFTSHIPARRSSKDEVLADLFPRLRQLYFERWSQQLGKGHAVQILADADTLRRVLGGESTP